MNPSKRKWLARLEQAAKASEAAKEAQPQPVVEVQVAEPVVEEMAETPAAIVVEETPVPVVSGKKKKY